MRAVTKEETAEEMEKERCLTARQSRWGREGEGGQLLDRG
jgi:hypothetical protein